MLSGNQWLELLDNNSQILDNYPLQFGLHWEQNKKFSQSQKRNFWKSVWRGQLGCLSSTFGKYCSSKMWCHKAHKVRSISFSTAVRKSRFQNSPPDESVFTEQKLNSSYTQHIHLSIWESHGFYLPNHRISNLGRQFKKLNWIQARLHYTFSGWLHEFYVFLDKNHRF